jgi:diguanylate cyclase (GGDEF)-like protein
MIKTEDKTTDEDINEIEPGTKGEKRAKSLYIDDLTQIFNRRYLSEKVPRFLERAKEKKRNIAFFMFDMDNFKSINDGHGHRAGDKALVHITKKISQRIKRRGTAIRYAGDEFILLVPGVDKLKAWEFGTEIQKDIIGSPLKIGKKQIPLACSAGISLFPKDGRTWKTLFKKADEALYEAKFLGKGKVILFPDTGKFMLPTKLDSILENPPIVGRDELLKFLETHLSEKTNQLWFPVILGPDGSGKTRLLVHAEELVKEKLSFVLFVKGYPFWQRELYGAIFSALGNLFEQQPSTSDLVFSKLDKKYKLMLKPNIYPWQAKKIEQKEEVAKFDSTNIFEALTQTFIILRGLGDGAILLDNADQVDPPSLQFLDSLFGQEGKSKLFFVSTINSTDVTAAEEKVFILLDSMPEVTARGKVKKYHLEPLRVEDLQQLVAKLFNGKTLPEESAKALIQNSAGNPLFIVETLSHLLQKGKIEPIGQEWSLAGALPEDMPIHLSDLMKDRLKRMDKDAINVLMLGSILGEKINPYQLAEMSNLKVQQVLNILVNARRLLFIEETTNPDEFSFAHPTDRNIFYSLMSEDERRKYHALAAEIEEKHAAGSIERILGRLAYHYQNSGQLDKAVKMFSSLKNQIDQVFISKDIRKMLQKRIISESMARESPLSAEDLLKAPDLGRAFKTAVQTRRLYPKENENVKLSAERFLKFIESFLAAKTEVLSLSLTAETILLNGQPVPAARIDSQLTEDLYKTLNDYGLQGILFSRGITLNEVVRFLELFTRRPEEVASQWNALVEELDLSHILPDRKVFLAVSERKIVLDKEKIFVPGEAKEGEPIPEQAAQETQAFSIEQLEQLRDILGKFSKEKQELVDAVKSAEVGSEDFQRITELLNKTDFSKLEKGLGLDEAILSDTEEARHREEAPPEEALSEKEALTEEIPTRHEEAPPREDIPIREQPPPQEVTPPREEPSAMVQTDMRTVKEAEQNINLSFQDLNSDDPITKAKATAWLSHQEPLKLAEAGFKAITSDMSLKTRRLAATIIKKAGDEAVEALLKKINHASPSLTLIRMLKVADVFLDHSSLVPLLREIALLGPAETVVLAIEILKQIPGKDADSALLEMFAVAEKKPELNILGVFAERKIPEAVPLLLEIIRPKNLTQKEPRALLQAQACRTLGLIGSPDTVETLIAVAKASKLFSFQRSKPDSVRAAAAWALAKFPQDERIQKILGELKKDKSQLVRKAAGPS